MSEFGGDHLSYIRFLPFWPAIMFATFICGWMEGTAVLVLALVYCQYALISPPYAVYVDEDAAFVALVSFAICGGVSIVLVAALRETIQRLQLAKATQMTQFSELQHRVANNLQFVVAQLRAAQRSMQDPAKAKEIIANAGDRVMAMARMHRRLNDGSAYEQGLEPLLSEMIVNAIGDLPIRVSVTVSGAAELTIDEITALSLLVNEAAINAAKHVFSKGLGTRFDVSLGKGANGRLYLRIHDDGPGLETGETGSCLSFGKGIMQAFATQLGGSLSIDGSNGTSLALDFMPSHSRAQWA